jgi:hypothetical protein
MPKRLRTVIYSQMCQGPARKVITLNAYGRIAQAFVTAYTSPKAFDQPSPLIRRWNGKYGIRLAGKACVCVCVCVE